MPFTPLQNQAVHSRGGNVIVSASAGSGKTTVMIARILSLLAEGESLENMAVCTFTRSAAADMRDKLQNSLLDADSSGAAFAESQLLLLPTAQISTIHSWFQTLIRAHFYALTGDPEREIFCPVNVDPAMEIADEAEADSLLADAIDTVVEEEIANGDEDFTLFYDVMISRRSDDRLRSLITEVYRYAVTHEDPENWLTTSAFYSQELTQAVVDEERARLNKRFGGRIIDLHARTKAAGFVRNLPSLETLLARARGEHTPLAVPRGKIDEKYRALNDELIRLKEEFLAAEKPLLEYESLPDPDDPPVFTAVLVRLVEKTARAYSEAKRRAAKLDYSDLEQLAARLVSVTSVREKITAKYRYIFVDEYQDVNPIQERVISALTSGNTFLVGDVKQSIYAFRMCDPTFFLEKYRHPQKYGFLPPIELNANFRSATEILDFGNEVMGELMSEDFGQIDYNRDARLTSGENLGGGTITLNAVVYKRRDPEENGVYSVENHTGSPLGNHADAETNLVVADIARKLREGRVPEGDGFRPCRPSDFAILLSARGEYASLLYEKLRLVGIPVASADSVYFTAIHEIAVLIEFMKYLSDHSDDLALAASLRSYFGGFSDDDLAMIASSITAEKFYLKCDRYASEKTDELSKRLRSFFAFRDRYLEYSFSHRASEVVGNLVAETKYFAFLSTRARADETADALNAFLEHLAASPYGGSIGEYLASLDRSDAGYERNLGSDAVVISTIHGAKGLEYPFVYLVGASHAFNFSDLYGKIILDRDLGVCMKNFDLTERKILPNKRIKAAAMKLKRKLLEERLRLLYVAITRAKFGLSVYACCPDSDPLVTFAPFDTDPESGYSFFEWLRPVYARRGYRAFAEEDCAPSPVEMSEMIAARPDPNIVERLKEQFAPFSLPTRAIKKSVTAVVKERADDEQQQNYLTGNNDDRTAAKGSAYHRAMELASLELSPEKNWENLAKYPEIAALVDKQKLSSALAALKEISTGGKLYREKPFVFDAGGTLVQGVVDALVVNGKDCTLIDYKTSRTTTIESGAYDLQLGVYAAAVERVLGLTVTRALVYSFESGEFYEVKRETLDDIMRNLAAVVQSGDTENPSPAD